MDPTPLLAVGTVVEAQWPPAADGFDANWSRYPHAEGKTWYPGKIVSKGGEYSIEYEDGGKATGVGQAHVRPAGTPKQMKRKGPEVPCKNEMATPKKQRRVTLLTTVPFCHPGKEKEAFGKKPPDSFLLRGQPAKGAEGESRQFKCPMWALEEGDQRYVISHHGRVVAFDANGSATGEQRVETLRCWAEYSGPAEVVVDHGKPADLLGAPPTRVSEIFMDPAGWGLSITDNDPCLFFGAGFNYTLCKQHSRPQLAKLGSGSMLLFGSAGGDKGWQKSGTGKFYLDTVFVVGESVEVSTGGRDVVKDGKTYSNITISDDEWDGFVGKARVLEALKDEGVPPASREAWRKLFAAEATHAASSVASSLASHSTGAGQPWRRGPKAVPLTRWPTENSKGPELRRVFKGQGPRKDDTFSFVPAWRAGDQVGDEPTGMRCRPTLDLDRLSSLGMPRPRPTNNNPKAQWAKAVNGQLTGTCDTEIAPSNQRKIWTEIVRQVREQGFEIASWFAPPPPMPPVMKRALDGAELSPKAKVTLAESGGNMAGRGTKLKDGLWEKAPERVWTVERLLAGPALRLSSKGEKPRVVSFVDRAQREAMTFVPQQ
jgi:hypothetical protein